jgi:hypothetical protein
MADQGRSIGLRAYAEVKRANIHQVDPGISLSFVSGGSDGSCESNKSYDEIKLPERRDFIP